jgi:hypothetical protein
MRVRDGVTVAVAVRVGVGVNVSVTLGVSVNVAEGVDVHVDVGVCVAVNVIVDSGPLVSVAPPVSGITSSELSPVGYSMRLMMMGRLYALMLTTRSTPIST